MLERMALYPLQARSAFPRVDSERTGCMPVFTPSRVLGFYTSFLRRTHTGSAEHASPIEGPARSKAGFGSCGAQHASTMRQGHLS